MNLILLKNYYKTWQSNISSAIICNSELDEKLSNKIAIKFLDDLIGFSLTLDRIRIKNVNTVFWLINDL